MPWFVKIEACIVDKNGCVNYQLYEWRIVVE